MQELNEVNFKKCLRENCNCEFVSTKKNIESSFFKIYFAFCVFLITFVAVYFYLKNNFMNIQTFIKVSECSELKEFFLNKQENEFDRIY
jgi:hypothetical protein